MTAPKLKKTDRATHKATRNESKHKLHRSTRVELYADRGHLGRETLIEFGLRMPVDVYFKDPRVAELYKEIGIDPDFTTPWEPGLREGPTSARFAVVDYDSTTNTFTPPAIWDEKQFCYTKPDGTPLNKYTIDSPQFRQLSVWATVQNTLDFFESSAGLGRRIDWAFEGSRLIVVPHAGLGQNAYYDRASKSLQLYWFDSEKGRVYTCLSSDIVNHEFGHAVLDGLRPYYYESVRAETAAFHEFMGDLAAILMAFSNNRFRGHVLEESHGNLDNDKLLSSLAQQFGEATTGADYLRSALEPDKMQDKVGTLEPHALSVVLTGTMFDILKGVFTKHRNDERERANVSPKYKPSDRTALAHTVNTMQTLAIQPLDLLPPCDVTFHDYALAVLRAEQVANPTDSSGYRELMLDCFIERGILDKAVRTPLLKPAPVFKRPPLDVFHPVVMISASRGSAYRFLDDNRAKLFIPLNADLVVTEIVRAKKRTSDARSLPEQLVIQYIWREELSLDDKRYGRFAGQRTTMLCGATIVLDQNGNLIHWSRKPGTASVGTSEAAIAEQEEGVRRRKELLDTIAARVASGMIGETIGNALGLIERASPPFGLQKVDGEIRFQLAPHFSIKGDVEHEDIGDRQWQISF